MCLPIFTLTFCAVFAPGPAHADAAAPVAVVSAVAAPAATAAPLPVVSDRPAAVELPAESRREAVRLAAAHSRSEPRAAPARVSWTDTEAKGGDDSAQDTREPTDTEQK